MLTININIVGYVSIDRPCIDRFNFIKIDIGVNLTWLGMCQVVRFCFFTTVYIHLYIYVQCDQVIQHGSIEGASQDWLPLQNVDRPVDAPSWHGRHIKKCIHRQDIIILLY